MPGFGALRRERALEYMRGLEPPAAVAHDRRLVGDAVAGSSKKFEALMWMADPTRRIDFCAATFKRHCGYANAGPFLDKLAEAGLIEEIRGGHPIRMESLHPGRDGEVHYYTEVRSGAGTYYRTAGGIWHLIHMLRLFLDDRAGHIEEMSMSGVVDDLLALQAEFEAEKEEAEA